MQWSGAFNQGHQGYRSHQNEWCDMNTCTGVFHGLSLGAAQSER